MAPFRVPRPVVLALLPDCSATLYGVPLEQVTLKLLLLVVPTAAEAATPATAPSWIFEPAPAVTEQLLLIFIRTWKLAVAVAALAEAAKVPRAPRAAITASLAISCLFISVSFRAADRMVVLI